MTIYRGEGGGGNATTDSELNKLTELTQQSQNFATLAEIQATNAAASAVNAATSEANALSSENSTALSATLAQDWAIKTDAPVSGGEYSSKYHAQSASNSASSASISASNAASSETNAAAYAASINPSDLVHISGTETITGTKTFSNTIVGSISGNATTVTNGVYTTGNQTIAGTKTFSGNLSYTGTLTGGTGVINIGSGQIYKDASGNVGIGVTPSAWSQGKAFEVYENGYGVWNGTKSSYLTANTYFNSGFKYAYTGHAASHYYQFQGAHVWSTAPSGTAGNPITFTQAMTLDASGNLLVGTTGSINNGGYTFGVGSTSNYNVGHASGSASGSPYVTWYYSGSNIGSITQNGTTAVAYNTTSDHRLKENVRPADAKRFMDIEFVDFEWVDGRHDCGVIAHQLQSVYPDLVLGDKDAIDADGNPAYQQVNYTGLIGRIGARVQQLQRTVDSQAATIEQLTARITALEAK